MRIHKKTSLTVLSCGIPRRPVAALAFLLLTVFLQVPASHAKQGEPGDALIQTFITFYEDPSPNNRLGAMVLSVGTRDHKELVDALRKRLPQAVQGEREIVLYVIAELGYDPITKTAEAPADIEAFLNAFPSDYATYEKMFGATQIFEGKLLPNTQLLDFLAVLMCDSRFHAKAATALAQAVEFNHARDNDALFSMQMGAGTSYSMCEKSGDENIRKLTPRPAPPPKPYYWEGVYVLEDEIEHLLESKDYQTRIAAMLAMRMFTYVTNDNLLTQKIANPATDEERTIGQYTALYNDGPQGDFCRDFPKTQQGIEKLLELEKATYRRQYAPNIVTTVRDLNTECTMENGDPLFLYLLKYGKKYMSQEEYANYAESIAEKMSLHPVQYKQQVRRILPDFKEEYARYVARITRWEAENPPDKELLSDGKTYLQRIQDILKEFDDVLDIRK